MSWDFDFDEDSFLDQPFGESFDTTAAPQFLEDKSFDFEPSQNPSIQQPPFLAQQPQFCANLNQNDAQQYFSPQPQAPQFMNQQFPNPQISNNPQFYQQQQFLLQQQQFLPQQQQQFLNLQQGNQQLIEENNQLREFFLSLKAKAEQVENANQRLKGQLDECRNWFRQAMFSGISNGSK
ncbi:hypothetical protein TRFO_10927 [Tritrichomonas foetus]|uniref:Uncharacterized protein n=1 Tax=Tritrichomonas foetus TaxID=1144522 RepID=A0A1J4J6A8_9EUKA|nr:hypothetical protein TRFO_10927 [Tritrichomonas foetus]|eukprot:OHS94758.1 hypothetical protein TRFO_10927 [Tritrichomonas foetus]